MASCSTWSAARAPVLRGADVVAVRSRHRLKVWNAAAAAGYSSYFPTAAGGAVTDDHIPLNKAGIPTVDIIPFYRDLPDNSFGPTWHTTSDTMEHIDKNTLKAVGQTVVQVLYSSNADARATTSGRKRMIVGQGSYSMKPCPPL